MSGAESLWRLRRILAGLILGVIALALFALAVALFLICLAGIALLVEGVASWLHPVDVASAWARTLAGIGLIGGSAGLAALGWLAVERLVGPLGKLAGLRYGSHPQVSEGEALERESAETVAVERETGVQRARKFVAIVGILLALICLPFAVAIHAAAHGPWFAWASSTRGA